MNLLHLSPVVPYPPVDGDRQRSFFLLRRLALRHRVHALCFVRSEADRAGLLELRRFCASAQGVSLPAWRIRLNSLAAWPTRLPLNVASFFSRAMLTAAQATVAREAIEAVHAYRLRSAPYARALPVRVRVLDYTDSLTRYFDARALEPAPAWKRAYLRREARALRAYEVQMASDFDAGLISSPQDRDVLRAAGAADTLSVVGNGVDTGRMTPADRLTEDASVLFVGNMAYVPNAAGLQTFCRETWPRILAELPAATLTVVGLPPALSEGERARRYPAARFAGVVPDLLPYFHRARVAICPVPVAAGRQFKVIEAFAAGVPVVATPVVAGNLDAVPERHLLTAADPQAFAAQVVRLCRDADLAGRLRRAARDLAVAQYDWEQAGLALDRVYAGLSPAGTKGRTA